MYFAMFVAAAIVLWVSLYLMVRRFTTREIARARGELRSYVDELFIQRTQPRTQKDQHQINSPKVVDLATRKPPTYERPGTAQEVSPEVLGAITERLTCLFGKRVRVLSARPLPVPAASGDYASLWPQQGRQHIHSSHEFVQRGM